MKRKILSVILAAAMLFTMIPMSSFEIKASASSGVQTKIAEIESQYPTGSYFSANGKACGHGQDTTCSNCRLSNVCPSAVPTCINAYTCLAFARYAFWYIFGLSPDAQSYEWATLDTINSIAKPGDFITFYYPNGKYYHAAIYLGSSSNGFYAYTSNYKEANDVKYNREYKQYDSYALDSNGNSYPYKFAESKYKVFHASNYDAINGTTSSDSTDVSIVSDYEKNSIIDTNAILYAMVYKPSSYAVTKIGIKVRKDGSTYDKGWSVYQNPSQSWVGHTSMQPYFNMNTELNATLVPGTKYWLQFYAVVNGKEYWSPEYYFSTTGSPYTLTIKYDSNGGIISSNNYEITSDGLVKRLSDNSTKFHVVDYNEYDDFYNCGTFGLTKNGYKFAGWTVEDGSTVYDMNKSWYPEDIYPVLSKGSATITAKAVWIPNTLTISYNANGGIGEIDKEKPKNPGKT